MAITDLDRLRSQIADRARLALNENLGKGDGSVVHFRVIGIPVLAGSFNLYVDGVAQVETTDFALDYAVGLVEFTTAPSSGLAVLATYKWATFSDEELSDLLTSRPVERAAARAISWLLADVDLFMRYTYGQESADRSQSRKGLEMLYQDLKGAGAPVALALADTPVREETMAPFIEQAEELLSDLQS